jgi:hypothetical protein
MGENIRMSSRMSDNQVHPLQSLLKKTPFNKHIFFI